MGLFEKASPVGLATSAVGMVINIGRAIKAGKERKQAQEAIDNYQRQELKNPYAGMSEVPSQSFQLSSEAADRELATNASLASRSGRGAAILPQAGDIYNRRNAEIAGNIEKYQYERDKLYGMGQSEVQNLQEERENADISGLANRYAVADQNMGSAWDGIGNAAAYGLEKSGIDGAVQGGWNPFRNLFGRNKIKGSPMSQSDWSYFNNSGQDESGN